MPGLIPVTASGIRLNAYASSGLPVEYTIIQGSDKISLSNQGDYWQVIPLQVGIAQLVASQAGDGNYGSAFPVVRKLYIYSSATAVSNIQVNVRYPAYQMPYPVNATLMEPPAPPLASYLDTVPLEPRGVTYEILKPLSPSYVSILEAPDSASNVLVSLTPQVTNLIAFEALAPAEPTNINTSINVPPTINYAINLTLFIDDPIETESEVDTLGYADFWTSDQSSSYANNYKIVSGDKYSLPNNPNWSFSSRSFENITNFTYENINFPQGSGGYGSAFGLNTQDKYSIYWRQETLTDGSIVPEDSRHNMMFVACHYVNAIISVADLPFDNNDDKISAVAAITNDFYLNNASISPQGYDQWVANVMYNYGEVLTNPNNSYEGKTGFFVLDKNPYKARLIKAKTLSFTQSTVEEFTQNISILEHLESSREIAASKLPNEIDLFYDKIAGDIEAGLGDSLNHVLHHPTIPIPFKEIFINSDTKYQKNIYEVKGEGIRLHVGQYINDIYAPTEVTTIIA